MLYLCTFWEHLVNSLLTHIDDKDDVYGAKKYLSSSERDDMIDCILDLIQKNRLVVLYLNQENKHIFDEYKYVY
jgi:hypothetical protein